MESRETLLYPWVGLLCRFVAGRSNFNLSAHTGNSFCRHTQQCTAVQANMKVSAFLVVAALVATSAAAEDSEERNRVRAEVRQTNPTEPRPRFVSFCGLGQHFGSSSWPPGKSRSKVEDPPNRSCQESVAYISLCKSLCGEFGCESLVLFSSIFR